MMLYLLFKFLRFTQDDNLIIHSDNLIIQNLPCHSDNLIIYSEHVLCHSYDLIPVILNEVKNLLNNQ